MSTKNAAKGPKVVVDSAQQADQMTEEGAPDSAPQDASRRLSPKLRSSDTNGTNCVINLLRKAADFDNYRKRVERERREMVELAAQDLLSERCRSSMTSNEHSRPTWRRARSRTGMGWS